MTTIELIEKTRRAYIEQAKQEECLKEVRAAAARPRGVVYGEVKSKSAKKDLSDSLVKIEKYALRALRASARFMDLSAQLRDRLRVLPYQQADIIYYRDVYGMKWRDLEKKYDRTRQWLSKLRTCGLRTLEQEGTGI